MTKKILLSALALLGVVSCVKDQFDESLGDRVTITLTAENPGFASDAVPTAKSQANDSTTALATTLAPVLLDSTATFEESIAALGDRVVYSDSTMFICQPMGMAPDTKTGLSTEGEFFWEPGDKIGFIYKCGTSRGNSELTAQVKKPSLASEFKGTINAKGKLLFAFGYMPYDSNIPNNDKTIPNFGDINVNVSISENQKPKYAESFAGNADILVSDIYESPKTSVDLNTYKGINLTFHRKVGFMKFGLFKEDHSPLEERIISLTISAPETVHLVGAANLDLRSGVLSSPTTGGNSVTVTYPEGGSQNAYIGIYPQTFEKDTKLTFTLTTDKRTDFTVEKVLSKATEIVENKYTFFGLIPDAIPPTEIVIPTDNAWLNFTKSNEAMAKALEIGDMTEYNRILSERILLDYSYAGYHYGEKAPDVPAGKRYNVEEYGAVGTDNTSDREAFIKALNAAAVAAGQQSEVANDAGLKINPGADLGGAVIYFPEGTFILHDDSDNVFDEAKESQKLPEYSKDEKFFQDSKGNNTSYSIEINASNFVIKGAGRDLTKIKMVTENLPDTRTQLYSSPEMILVKSKGAIGPTGFELQGKAARGSFSVTTNGGTPGVGTWVCLYMDKNTTDKYDDSSILYDTEGYSAESYMTEMIGGIDKNNKKIAGKLKVREFHKVAKVEGNVVTFTEPIMRDVDCTKDGRNEPWELRSYTPYEEIGFEDFTFVGNSTVDFDHHATWKDDGGYKPLQLTGVANSWIRRVNYENISECATFAESANCSAYDILIQGKRGHSGIRSNGSSRIFLGKIFEKSKGKYIAQGQNPNGDYIENAGQYHASGVSKQSIGAVLWRNHWGDDSSFESHSSQPRATLVDHCTGGWVEWRFGGDKSKTPNHLRDLTIWNFYSVRFYGRGEQRDGYKFWSANHQKEKWRVAPPILVGFSGTDYPTFDQALTTEADGQLKYVESMGTPVGIESLYEAQLELRLGSIPTWLSELKTINY